MRRNDLNDVFKDFSKLNPKRSVMTLFGHICKNPEIVRNPEMPLNEDDFYSSFHKVVYSAMSNIVYSDASIKKIKPTMIDEYLYEYDTLYEKWKEQNGLKFIDDCIKASENEETMQLHYDRVRKYSSLRECLENGFDTRVIFDHTTDDIRVEQEGRELIDKMTVDEIVDQVTMRALTIREKFTMSDEMYSYRVGDGIRDYAKTLGIIPRFGFPFRNKAYNSIFRGMGGGKYMLRSADTGVGKTRTFLGDVCFTSMTHIWCEQEKDFVQNYNYMPSVYIPTEATKEEVYDTTIAIVSGINEDIIKMGNFGVEVKARVDRAIEIIENSPMYVTFIEDFSALDIELIIEKHIINDNVFLVAFDYIHHTGKLAKTTGDNYGGNLREDQVLVDLSKKLKSIAVKYNVFVLSGTQLNRNRTDKNLRDTSSLRGGSATADKVDFGIMLFEPDSDDIRKLESIIGGGKNPTPNYSHWVYKNRGNRHSDVIIWTKMDLGTMQEEVLFITDKNYRLISDIQLVDIVITEDGEKEITHKDLDVEEYTEVGTDDDFQNSESFDSDDSAYGDIPF